MEIIDIQRKKKATEDKIATLVEAFEEETTLTVELIELKKVDIRTNYYKQKKKYINNVEMRILF